MPQADTTILLQPGIRKRRKKFTMAIGVLVGMVLLWLLFPPQIHRRLKTIRAMQAAANSQIEQFLNCRQDEQVQEPGVNASVEETEAYYEKQRRGPLADMQLEFDVNRYFEALDRLRMNDGYTLDCVYHTTSLHAIPRLYARLNTSPRLPDNQAFENTFGVPSNKTNLTHAWLQRIRCDGSRQGFIQLATLYLTGTQFCLYSHANYHDTKILSRIPAWVVFSGTEVSVSLWVFSKWGGLTCCTIRFNRSFPHNIVSEQAIIIVPYNCNTRF